MEEFIDQMLLWLRTSENNILGCNTILHKMVFIQIRIPIWNLYYNENMHNVQYLQALTVLTIVLLQEITRIRTNGYNLWYKIVWVSVYFSCKPFFDFYHLRKTFDIKRDERMSLMRHGGGGGKLTKNPCLQRFS